MDLQDYQRTKLDLADLLRDATMHSPQASSERGIVVRDLFARIAEDRFNLVVVGRFSRGKTSLMNAILGLDRLPTGVVPLTSVITTVSYGSEERAVLHYKHTSLFMDIPLSELEAHITERGNPGNTRGIRTADVQLPAEILRRGFFFIDTPGLGSSIIENTRTTETYLPEADAFILVTSYDSPLSEEELRVAETIQASGKRVFVVLNKQDSVAPVEREEVQAHLRHQLSLIFSDGVPVLYSVSARQGLEARLRNDQVALATSGLLELEAALIAFLVNDRRREFLLNVCARIEEIALASHAGAEIGERLRELRKQIAGTNYLQRTMPTSTRGAGLQPTLGQCEICERVSDEVFVFLAKYQARLHGDSATLSDFAKRGGLCGPHMKQFEALAAGQEVCTGFAGVLDRQAQILRSAAIEGGSSALLCEAVQQALPTEETCPACAIAQEAATNKIHQIARQLELSGDRELERLSAICLSHLGPLVEILPPQTGAALLIREAEILERLSDDMRRYALKQDGVRRDLASKEELTAARRGLRILLLDPNAETGRPVHGRGSNIVHLVRSS